MNTQQLLDAIKVNLKTGMTYSDIEKLLNSKGVKRQNGLTWGKGTLSSFLLVNGIRQKSCLRTKRKVSFNTDSYLKDVEEVITSNLTERLKVKLLQTIVVR